MKALKIAALLFVTATFVHAQDVVVKGNTKLNNDFSKYKTFTWAKTDPTAQPEAGYYIYSYTEEHELPVKEQRTTVKNGKTVKTTVTTTTTTPYTYSYNVIIPSSNTVINTTVQNSLKEELEARGYRQNDTNADLLVTYRVLERTARMRGYINDNPTMVAGREVREVSDTTTHILEPGTLLISLIDTKTSEVVWDGFASGLVREKAFITDETKIKEAVHLIMEEFKYRGDKITKVD
ncbi:MAG TPA: DUF4136 domain-containing protein [Ohtaekwangia sp.]